MNVVELRGIERRSYVGKDGGQKEFCGLHVCWQDWDGKEDTFLGEKCENFSCPREANPDTLRIGELYEVQFSVFQTKNGLGARVSNLVPFSESK